MKKAAYMAKAELMQFLKLSVLWGEVEEAVKTTEEKNWRRKLKCICTYLDNILDERLRGIDKEQLQTDERRSKHSCLKLYTSDQNRTIQDNQLEEKITMATEDVYDLVDMALLTCYRCEQGGCVKDCKIRRILHTIGCPPIRTEPQQGECEFTTNAAGEVKSISPQYKRILADRL